MAQTDTAPKQKTCFVVMGFGKKTDFETGRLLDLDVSYKTMIKPAVEAAGLRCIRADEIVHSGLIDVPMYEHLLNADVVVADLSTSNKNAFYELGVRHALRPQTTIIIAEDGIKAFPFDINHVAVRQYHHLGEDINTVEARRFQLMLTDAIEQILANDPVSRDSPVYTFLDLTPPALKKVQEAALITMTAVNNLAAISTAATKQSHMALMNRVNAAQEQGKWFKMQMLLEVVRENQAQAREEARKTATVQLAQDDREDPYILQQLALATYKSKEPSPEEALLDAQALLVPLTPATTNDTETLGIWGSIHKRLWEVAKGKAETGAGNTTDPAHFLNEAVRAYERGFNLHNDHYNGINLAFLLNTRAAVPSAPAAEAIADYVQAQRVRREVITLCDQWLAAQAASQVADEPPAGPEQKKDAANRYWVLASQGEAYVGLGQAEQADQTLQQAYALAPEAWMKETTQEQLAKLSGLLAVNPLQYITATPGA